MRRGTRRALMIGPLIAVGLLTSCSDSPEAGGTQEMGPLGEYLAAGYGGDLSEAEQQAAFDEQNRRSEELVAACMAEEGFEYTPNTSASTVSFGGDAEWNPEDRDWVSQYGYGAVTSPGQEEAEQAPVEEYVDPNADYVESLTASEQAAFYEALSGPQPTEEEMAAMEDGEYEYDYTTAGCSGEAQQAVAEEDPLQTEQFTGLMDAINTFYEGQASLPGMAEVDAAWSSCMADAGQPGFTVQGDAAQSIYDRQNELYESSGETGEIDQAELDALGEDEVELALVDLDCREETDYREVVQGITLEQEEQFVDDHRAELDTYRAAAEQGR